VKAVFGARAVHPSAFWSIFNLVALFIFALGLIMDIKTHASVLWIVADAGLALLFIWGVHFGWAWYPEEEDEEEPEEQTS
jgi:hypothetical protein